MVLFFSFVLLFFSLFFVFKYRNDILHPAFWTNIGFIGYSIGGIFFYVFGYDSANFLNISIVEISDRDFWFLIAILIAIAGFLSCNVGFYFGNLLFKNRYAKSPALNGRLSPHVQYFGWFAAIALIALGVAYWIYFAEEIAGGVPEMIGQVAVYRLLAAEKGMSALPFNLVYAGALLWMLICIDARKHSFVSLLFLPVGFIVMISTGRIASSNAFLFSAVLAFVFSSEKAARIKTFIYCLMFLLPFNVIFYFFRQYTSYLYMGRGDDFPLLQPDVEMAEPKIVYVLKALIGGGNVPDLQQLILVVHGIINDKLHLEWGSTYFDWLRNLFGSRIGLPHLELHSVGYRILAVYFPDKVGGPTPGMIGEAILNFGPFAPFAIATFCLAMTGIYFRSSHSNNVLIKLLYCQFLVGIWALFLKVDSSLLLGYLWVAGPITVCWLSLLVVARIRGLGRATES